MKMMKVFQFADGTYLRLNKGKLGETLVSASTMDIKNASKSTSEQFFKYILRGEGNGGKFLDVGLAIVEPRHMPALRYLRELLEKEKTFAQEQVDTAHLPEDRKDAGRDIEKIDLIIELLERE